MDRGDRKKVVAVEIRKGKLCLLSSVGIAVRDMKDLICRYGELKGVIRNKTNIEEFEGMKE